MSRSVDERIVEMKFDNNQFERGVQTSLSTLDKLKAALNFVGTAKSLEEVSDSMKGLNFGSAISGIQSLSDHFSAFGVIGDQILRNIGDKISEFGFKVTGIAKSLSIDQIGVGFGKFEELTKNTATLVGQGYDLGVVEKQLERLNWFTDETSYNFTDMVQNIGKFTASGQELEPSVTAMEGIATWAALSGQNASTASRAMYQLSQAMSAGVMRREDYRSIQNASMDTREFRQHALDAAVALGTLKKNADGTYTSIVKGMKQSTFTIDQFANNLTQEGWFTSDVMMSVFGDYSAAVDQLYEYATQKGITASEAMEELNGQIDAFGLKAFKAAQEARSWGDVLDSVKDAVSTGWMQTFKLIFGNYEEATALWTSLANSLYDVFTFGTEERNTLLEFWRNLGGRDKMVNAVTGSIENFAEALYNIKFPFIDAITEQNKIFDRLNEVRASAEAKGLDPELAIEGMVQSAPGIERVYEILNKFSRVGAGVGAVFDIMKQAVSAFVETLRPLLSFLPKVGEKLLDIAANFGDWAVRIKEAAESSNFFTNIFKTLADTLSPITKFLGDAILDFLNLIDNFTKVKDISGAVNTITEKVSPLTKVFTTIKNVLSAFTKFLTGSFTMVKPIFTALGETIKTFFKGIGDALARGDIRTATSIINGLIAGKTMLGIGSLTKTLKESGDALSGFIGKISGFLGGGEKGNKAADMIANIKNFAVAFAILAGSMFVLGTIDTGKLFTVFIGLEVMMHALISTVKAMNELKSGKLKESIGNFMNMLSLNSIASAVLIMSLAAKLLSTIDFAGLVKGLVGVGALLLELSIAMKYLSSAGIVDKKAIGGMVGFAASLLIIAQTLKQLAAMSVDELIKSVIAMGVILTELAIFSNFSGGSFSGASFLAISVALLLICQSVKQFADMDLDGLLQGLGAVGTILLELALFSVVGSEMSGGLLLTAAAMVILGIGIIELAGAVAIFAAIDYDRLVQGLVALGVVLTELLVFSAIGTALGPDMIVTAGALVVMASALLILTPALIALSVVPMEKLMGALLGLAVAFGVFAAAGVLLAPLAPDMLAAAGAMAAFGAAAIVLDVAIAGLGIALQALGLGLSAIGEVIASVCLFAVNTIKSVLTGIGSLGKSIISFLKGDLKGAQQAVENADFETPITKSMGKAANAAKAGSAKIGKNAVSGITESKGLWETAVDGLTGLFSGKLAGAKDVVKENAAGLSKSAGEGLLSNKGLLSMISGENTDAILDAITGKIPEANKAGADLSQATADGSKSKFRVHYNTGADNAKAENSGYSSQNNNAYNTGATGAQKSADGSKSKWNVHYNTGTENAKAENSGYASQNGNAYNTGANGAQQSANGASSKWQIHYNAGSSNAGAVASGFNGNSYQISNAAYNAARSAANNANRYGDMYWSGQQLSRGLADGIWADMWRVEYAANSVANVVNNRVRSYNMIYSPSRLLAEAGKYLDMGLAKGVEDNLSVVAIAADALAKEPMNALDGIGQQLSNAIAMDFDDTFTLTPVLDMSTARQQMAGLGGSIGIGANLAYAAAGAENAAGPLNPITLNIYGAQGQDVGALADIVIDRLTSKLQRENSRWK